MKKGCSDDGLSNIVSEDVDNIIGGLGTELQALDGRTVLITGSTGFLAREVTETLLRSRSDGLDISIVLTTRDREKAKGVFGHRLDDSVVIITTDAIAEYEENVDYIIHAASPCDPRSYNRDPLLTMTDMVAMTGNALTLASRSDAAKFVYLSSGAVYGPQPTDLQRIPEDYPGAPSISAVASCYAEAKRFCELMVIASGLPYTIARGFSFIGPDQDMRSSFAVPDLITQAMRDRRIVITGDGRPIRTFCYESDLAIALLKLMMRKDDIVLNVGNDRPEVSIRELAEMIAEIVGEVDVEIKTKAPDDVSPPRYVPNIDRMREVFDPSIGLRASLSRTITHVLEVSRVSGP